MTPVNPARGGTLSVAIATPLPDDEDLCALMRRIEPRLSVEYRPDLLPPMRWPADHSGDPGWRRTDAQQNEFDRLLAAADVLYGFPDGDPASLRAAVQANPGLKWVQGMAAGAGAAVAEAHLSAEDLQRVVFTTSAGVHADNLAEFAVFGALAGLKDLPRLAADKASRTWPERWPMRQLYDATVLVLGLGEIGRACAARFSAMGARVIGCNRTVRTVPWVEDVYPVDDLPEAARRADIIVVALPATAATEKLVSADVIGRLRPKAMVINVGRGSTVDEDALIDGLRSGALSYAALDVSTVEPLPVGSPLWGLDNVLISPHTATLDAREDRRIAEHFAANATRLLNGEPMTHVVNTVEFY
ncbi:D-2-hydroxyacid dehydrogenase [Acidipropionibacterium virtanenii]|uniref:D-3-phosphoglycerate dehydrogenase n=1 Tax=Acidipropionibacterium virtanenii TaxID=2057246 RepID=A0A344UQH1_9ACTN|nr:D-2-hydroxyacid dehydrogenase [Acidipropionibacterium virtanenii]AXE37519.1 D-3-phosphoglycerate dehydrogenase [Acidipropionibacterium virtanenii]